MRNILSKIFRFFKQLFGMEETAAAVGIRLRKQLPELVAIMQKSINFLNSTKIETLHGTPEYINVSKIKNHSKYYDVSTAISLAENKLKININGTELIIKLIAVPISEAILITTYKYIDDPKDLTATTQLLEPIKPLEITFLNNNRMFLGTTPIQSISDLTAAYFDAIIAVFYPKNVTT